MPRPLVVGMLMVRIVGFIVGALTFAAAHAVERAHWYDWFQGSYDPWFLNSGRALLFTTVLLGVASALVAAAAASGPPVRGITIGAGAFAAMTIALFLKPEGAGTIFPLVLIIGGAFLIVGSTIGALAGTRLSQRIRAMR